MNKFKIGDRVRIKYISDCNPYNGVVGIINWLHRYKYYPTGVADKFEYKVQGHILYPCGNIFSVNDMYRDGGGAVSPVEKISL